MSDRPVADWSGERAARWAAVADRLEVQIAEVGDLLMAAARLRPGERVLDVGCGRGVTTRRAAVEVGATGAVTGLDIAAALLAEARRVDHDGAPVDYLEGDAQVHPLPAGTFDAVISRFGVMFFRDPAAAFANLRRATTPGGRLCVAVWQPRHRSPLMQRPIDVAAAAAEALGVRLSFPGPDEGAFSLGDPEVAARVLEVSGWADVSFEPRTLVMYSGGPGPVDVAVETALSMGALHDALADQPPELREAVRAALAADLAPLHDGTGVALEGAVAILRARAG